VKDRLDGSRAAVVHLAVHGSEDGTLWQASSRLGQILDRAQQHHRISPDELVEHLAAARDALAVVLNVCDSARGADALGRRIAERGVPVVVGMSGLISVVACSTFSRSFYRGLAHGLPFIDAYAAGVRAVRDRDDAAAALWTMPVLYASNPGLVAFPPAAQVRARRMAHQIRDVARLLVELSPGRGWTAADWSRATVHVQLRLQAVRSVVAGLAGKDPAPPGEPLLRRLELSRLVAGLEGRMAAVDERLRRLGTTRLADTDRTREAALFAREQQPLAADLRRLGDLLAGAPADDDRSPPR